MPASVRPWREAIAVLNQLGWSDRDIAVVLHLAPATVRRVLGRPRADLPRTQPPPYGTCSHPVGKGWCDAPVTGGRAFCDEHWRLAWPS